MYLHTCRFPETSPDRRLSWPLWAIFFGVGEQLWGHFSFALFIGTPQNGTVFGKEVFKEVIKLKLGTYCGPIPNDWCPSMKRLGPRHTEVRAYEDKAHSSDLQAKRRGLRRDQPCRQLDLRLPAPRAVREWISVVRVTWSVAPCENPSELMQRATPLTLKTQPSFLQMRKLKPERLRKLPKMTAFRSDRDKTGNLGPSASATCIFATK